MSLPLSNRRLFIQWTRVPTASPLNAAKGHQGSHKLTTSIGNIVLHTMRDGCNIHHLETAIDHIDIFECHQTLPHRDFSSDLNHIRHPLLWL